MLDTRLGQKKIRMSKIGSTLEEVKRAGPMVRSSVSTNGKTKNQSPPRVLRIFVIFPVFFFPSFSGVDLTSNLVSNVRVFPVLTPGLIAICKTQYSIMSVPDSA